MFVIYFLQYIFFISNISIKLFLGIKRITSDWVIQKTQGLKKSGLDLGTDFIPLLL